MATEEGELKKYTEFRILRQIAMRIHNPQVIAAYTHRLDGDDGDNNIAKLLYDHLQVKSQDTFNAIVVRILIFYLVCGRLSTASTVPMWWKAKTDKFIPQLVIAYRPASRRKLSFGKYDPNSELHLPHYNGHEQPHIPSYTVGKYSAKYTLKDQTYILVNASTEDEAIKVVQQLANYVDKSFKPDGTILDNITTTKRRGKPLALDDREIVPYRGDYYVKGDGGYKKTITWQL